MELVLPSLIGKYLVVSAYCIMTKPNRILMYRLNTIMDSSKVLVMDAGHVAEFDTPQRLLADEASMFHALVTNWENSHEEHEHAAE